MPKHNCSSSPVLRWPALAFLWLQPEHGYLLCLSHHVIAQLKHNWEQHREHDFTEFFVAYLVLFWSWMALSHSWISRLCKAEQYAWLYFISTLHTHACACTWANHTVPKHTASNSAMASKVFPAWARYGLPSVSFVLWCAFSHTQGTKWCHIKACWHSFAQNNMSKIK